MAKAKVKRTRGSSPGKTMDMLGDIASNLWWSWHPEAQALFADMNPRSFNASNRNPVVALNKLNSKRRKELAQDQDFAKRVERVHGTLQRYLNRRTWFQTEHGRKVEGVTAYFCMEFALHESLPLYAGGLGVLAGDHVKSASDLGLPFVAIGIYWRRGYVQQQIDDDGQQRNTYPRLAEKETPLTEVKTKSGRPLRIPVPMGNETVHARVWRLDVGRIPLYLLDTDLKQNAPRHRKLVDVLYSGDRDMRVRQEILLGVGGWLALRAMDVPVSACHLNEGHAAFLSFERMAECIEEEGWTYKQALRYVTDTNVFTTHTPVAAGNEQFSPALVDQYLRPYIDRLGISYQEFHDLARVKPGQKREQFGMTPLALRTSKRSNGVAALHGEIARKMWQPMYPDKPVKKVPIGHVTNGIHLRTWLHPEMAELLDRTLGKNWEQEQDRKSTWNRISKVDDEELWNLHLQIKQEMIELCRRRTADQIRRHDRKVLDYDQLDSVLDPDALTICFARRFASYKRAALVFSDPKRLDGIVNDPDRPVQLIFSGKAHPADTEGQAIIKTVNKYARQAKFRKRIVFVENYDMEVGRGLTSGCDVWLNNPERPREASGTSGMKPAAHGGLNLSILDGWWPEGYNGTNGWAIGKGKDHDGTRAADKRDVEDLYRTLERKVVPLYYKRDASGIPRDWVARMKDAIATIPVFFNTHRQVKQYLTKYYLPAMKKA